MPTFIEARLRTHPGAASKKGILAWAPAVFLMAVIICIRAALAQEPQPLRAQNPDTQAAGGTQASATPVPTKTPDQVLPDDKNIVSWSAPGTTDSWWRGKLLPHFCINSHFDDNIFIQHDHKVSDFVTTLGIGLRAGVGDVENPLSPIRNFGGLPLIYEDPTTKTGNFLFADYTAIPVLYARTSSQDTYNQDALVRGGWTDSRLSVNVESRFQSLTVSDIDVGNLVREKTYSDRLAVNYALTRKIDIESVSSFNRTEYPTVLISTTDWLEELWLNYKVTAKVETGPGVGFGLTEIQNSPDQSYQRFQYRVRYQASEKVCFNGKAGFENRQLGDGISSRQYSIYSLGVAYSIFNGTTLEVNGYRDMGVSALLSGQNYITTGGELLVRQRLVEKLYLTLAGCYENLDYLPVAKSVEANRNDDYVSGRASVAFDIRKWCNAQVFYKYQRDCSSTESNSFVDNQIGFEMNFAF